MAEKLLMKIGSTIKLAREQKQLRAVDIADEIDISTATISNIENGKIGRRVNAIRNLFKLLEYLDIDPEENSDIQKFLNTVHPTIMFQLSHKDGDNESSRNKKESKKPQEVEAQLVFNVTSPIVGTMTRFNIRVASFIGYNPGEETESDRNMYQLEHKAIEKVFNEFFEEETLFELERLVNEQIQEDFKKSLERGRRLEKKGWETNTKGR